MENKKQIITDEVLIKYGFKVTSDVFNDPGGEKHYEKEYNDKNGEKVVVEIIYDYFVGCYLFRTFGLQGWIKTTDKLNRALQILDLDDTNSVSDNEVNTNRNELEKHKSVEWSEDSVKKALLLEVLPLFMNGGEADEVVAKLDEVMNNKKYEKQGEQILANSAKTCKIEPKFKIGDWVIIDNNHNSLYQIEKIENYKYYLRHFLGGAMPLNFSDEEDLRFWTIDDAKEGDVIAIGNEYFLFKEKNKNTSSTVYISHCFCNSAKAFRVTNGRDCGEFFPVENGSRVHPATKEECDLLFQKMKEAGYEWDAKKKKLMKIEKKSVEENKGNIEKFSSNWSAGDEKFLVDTMNFLYRAKNQYAQTVRLEKCIDWLISLKKRLQSQNSWKPSDEQDAKNKKLIKINSQQTEVKDTTKLITAELLEKNGFEFSHERCEGFECYSLIKFKGNVDIDLMHYENPNTDWLLTIMFNDCEKVLIKVISTVDELQQCLDIMGIELKIKI